MQMSENGLELLKQWEGFKLAVYEGPVIGGRWAAGGSKRNQFNDVTRNSNPSTGLDHRPPATDH
jgi:GH24 family phage-related lysozyme (muramidase)